uniref:Translocator protein n=1 Tax=Oncorhynchus kisutch TaxID=8019 RepID=A0A8C7C6F6_ONCKI
MSWLPMLCLTALPHLGGLYGGYITRKQVKTWYPTLNKPPWRPPNSALPIVWTTLYTGMEYGSYLVWMECGGFTEDAVAPLGLYTLQLALNWAWTPIFFGAHKLKMALIKIVMLTGAVGATMASGQSHYQPAPDTLPGMAVLGHLPQLLHLEREPG